MVGGSSPGVERATRLLLLEFLFDDPYGRDRSEHFPFFLGQARALGATAMWLLSGVYSRTTTHLNRHTIELSVIERELLFGEMADFRPTHLLYPDLLGPDLDAALRARFPDLQLIAFHDERPEIHALCPTGYLPEALGLRAPGDGEPAGSTYLVDTVTPHYDSELVAPPPGCERPEPPNTPIIAGTTCTYAARIDGSRFFDGVEVEEGMSREGCTFCRKMSGSRQVLATAPLDLALRQCEAARSTEHRYHADSFLIRAALVSLQVGRFIRAVVERDLPPSRFLFQYRVDELLRVASELDEVLPLAKRAGHRIVVYNMGVENFSPDENARFNKRIRPEQVDEAAACIDRWCAAFPDTFAFGNFGMILFTPWTTLGDIALNYERLRRKRYPGIRLDGGPLATKLQILPETAIAALARRDGALVGTFDDFRIKDGNCVGHGTQAELPWRFLHEEVHIFYDVVWRATSEEPDPDDALLSDIRALLASPAHPWAHRLDFLLDALAVSCESPPPRSAGEIVERIRQRLPETGVEAAAPEGRVAASAGGRLPPPGTPSEALLVAHADALHAALVRLESAEGSPLPGWRAAGCEQDFQDGVRGLRVELRLGVGRMGLRILPADAPCPAYVTGARLKIAHDAATALDTPAEARGVRELCAWLDAQLP